MFTVYIIVSLLDGGTYLVSGGGAMGGSAHGVACPEVASITQLQVAECCDHGVLVTLFTLR